MRRFSVEGPKYQVDDIPLLRICFRWLIRRPGQIPPHKAPWVENMAACIRQSIAVVLVREDELEQHSVKALALVTDVLTVVGRG